MQEPKSGRSWTSKVFNTVITLDTYQLQFEENLSQFLKGFGACFFVCRIEDQNFEGFWSISQLLNKSFGPTLGYAKLERKPNYGQCCT